MQIYDDQKGLCKSQVTECTTRFKSSEGALQAITDHWHVHIRFAKQDPTLFQNWSQLMHILGEIQELIETLHSKDVQAIADEAGDVLYVSCYGLRFSTEIKGELESIGKPMQLQRRQRSKT